MAVTLEDLEQRVVDLEREVALLKAENGKHETDAAETEFARQSRASQQAFSAGWAKALEAMGIKGQPIGAENVQAMLAAELLKHGIKPEDNYLSRMIIEAREE